MLMVLERVLPGTEQARLFFKPRGAGRKRTPDQCTASAQEDETEEKKAREEANKDRGSVGDLLGLGEVPARRVVDRRG